MRCPACHQNIRVQGKFCPKCGEQIFGLPVRGAPPAPGELPDFSVPEEPTGYAPPPPPAPSPVYTPPAYEPTGTLPEVEPLRDNFPDFTVAPSPGSVLDITLEEPAASAPSAGQEVVGKVCPFCRFPIKPGEQVQVCPACATPHHLDCWRENGGCTTYGCRASPQVGGVQPVTPAPGYPTGVYGGAQPASYGAPLPRTAMALLEQELDRLATNALIFSLLWFLCFIPAVIGLLTGISVLGQIRAAGARAAGARTKAWIAVALSTAVLAGLIWWLVALVAAGSGG